MKEKKKNGKWMKFRHRVVRNILCFFLKPYCILKYGIKVERFKEQNKRPYIILFNHQTAFDQFFVGMAFSGPVYYLASEDLFSKGWISSLIRYLVAPIPIKKQTTDVRAILNCMKVCKEGGTIALAPEGNRTYSGKTEYMRPAIVSMVKKFGLPVALFRIEGGYGVHPRWSDAVRRGKMRAYVSRVIEPEEYANYSDEVLMNIINEELCVNEGCLHGEFRHKRLAEYLERVVYVCPHCGLSVFESHGDIIECKKCARKVRFLPTQELIGEGFDFPFRFVSDWYNYQCDFVNGLDLIKATEKPLYIDKARLSEVIPYKNKVLICKDMIFALYGDRIEARGGDREFVFAFDKASTVTVLGRNKLNIYYDGRIYQLKGDKRFNALKYMNMYYRYNNLLKGEKNGKFLGL